VSHRFSSLGPSLIQKKNQPFGDRSSILKKREGFFFLSSFCASSLILPDSFSGIFACFSVLVVRCTFLHIRRFFFAALFLLFFFFFLGDRYLPFSVVDTNGFFPFPF